VAEQTNSFPVALNKGDDNKKTRSCEENEPNLQLTESSGMDRDARAGSLVIKDILSGTLWVRPARADAFTGPRIPKPTTSKAGCTTFFASASTSTLIWEKVVLVIGRAILWTNRATTVAACVLLNLRSVADCLNLAY
jgi:hypothetical protein